MATFTATVQTGKVSGTNSNFPAYVDLSTLPIAFWNTVTNGGGDIRVYTNSALTTEIPREVVSCDTTTDTGELWCKVGSMTSSTQVWITVDGTSADYAVTATYGRNNVWTVFNNIYHLEGDSTDSAGSSNGTDTNISYGTANGVIGQGADLNGSNSKIDIGVRPAMKTIIAWVKHDAASGEDDIYTDWGGVNYTLVFGVLSDRKLFAYGNNFGENIQTTDLLTNGVWYRVAYINKEDGSSISKVYINGASKATATATTLTSSDTLKAFIGAGDRGTSNFWDGKMDDVFLSESSLTDEWISTEYQNQNDNSAFWGTWSEVVGGQTISVTDGLSYTGYILINMSEKASDSFTITDSRLLNQVSIASDSLTTTENTTTLRGLFMNVLDNIGIIDFASATLAGIIEVFDAIGLTDAVTTIRARLISVSDNIGLTEAMTALKGMFVNVYDYISTQELLTTLRNKIVSVSDSIGLTDAISILLGKMVSVSDSIGLTGAITIFRGKLISVYDSMSLIGIAGILPFLGSIKPKMIMIKDTVMPKLIKIKDTIIPKLFK